MWESIDFERLILIPKRIDWRDQPNLHTVSYLIMA